jgi:hypothetical protein
MDQLNPPATNEPKKKRGRPRSGLPYCEQCRRHLHKCIHGKEEEERKAREEDEPEPAAAESAKDKEDEELGSQGNILNIVIHSLQSKANIFPNITSFDTNHHSSFLIKH